MENAVEIEELPAVIINDVSIQYLVGDFLDLEEMEEVTILGKGVYLTGQNYLGKTVHLVEETMGVNGDFVVDAIAAEDGGNQFSTRFIRTKEVE